MLAVTDMKIMKKNGSITVPPHTSQTPGVGKVHGISSVNGSFLVNPTLTLSDWIPHTLFPSAGETLKVTCRGCEDTGNLEKIPKSLLGRKLLRKTGFFSYFA